MLDQVEPRLPAWVINADLEPRPEGGESYRDYVARIGFDPDELLVELVDRTAVMANNRLAHALSVRHGEAYHRFLNAWCAARLPLERRRELRRWAENVIPMGRRRSRDGT